MLREPSRHRPLLSLGGRRLGNKPAAAAALERETYFAIFPSTVESWFSSIDDFLGRAERWFLAFVIQMTNFPAVCFLPAQLWPCRCRKPGASRSHCSSPFSAPRAAGYHPSARPESDPTPECAAPAPSILTRPLYVCGEEARKPSSYTYAHVRTHTYSLPLTGMWAWP